MRNSQSFTSQGWVGIASGPFCRPSRRHKSSVISSLSQGDFEALEIACISMQCLHFQNSSEFFPQKSFSNRIVRHTIRCCQGGSGPCHFNHLGVDQNMALQPFIVACCRMHRRRFLSKISKKLRISARIEISTTLLNIFTCLLSLSIPFFLSGWRRSVPRSASGQ